MYKNYKITVCMPCRNEAKHLKKVFSAIPKIVDEIIVVSNLSTDNTVELAKNLGAKTAIDDRVIGRIGYGYAHMTAIKMGKGDFIVGIDADGTYPVKDIEQIISKMILNDLDFVSGNRFNHSNSSHVAYKLRFGVWLLGIEARVLYGIKINDILSGMWVIRRSVRDDLALTEGNWNLSPQIKINAALNPKINYQEFNIRQKKRYGKTHQQYFKTGFSHAYWLLANKLSNKRNNKESMVS